MKAMYDVLRFGLKFKLTNQIASLSPSPTTGEDVENQGSGVSGLPSEMHGGMVSRPLH